MRQLERWSHSPQNSRQLKIPNLKIELEHSDISELSLVQRLQKAVLQWFSCLWVLVLHVLLLLRWICQTFARNRMPPKTAQFKKCKKKSVTIKKRKHFVILTWKPNVLCKTVPEEGFEVAFEWIIFYWKSFFVCSDWFLKIACKCQRSREKIDDIHW